MASGGSERLSDCGKYKMCQLILQKVCVALYAFVLSLNSVLQALTQLFRSHAGQHFAAVIA